MSDVLAAWNERNKIIESGTIDTEKIMWLDLKIGLKQGDSIDMFKTIAKDIINKPKTK